MKAMLQYCTGGLEKKVAAGDLILHEGGRTGRLYILIDGRV